MKRLIIALTLFGTALGANAALLMRGSGEPPPRLGKTRIDLGRTALIVPQALIRERAQMAGGRLDRLDLAVDITNFQPLPPPSARDPVPPIAGPAVDHPDAVARGTGCRGTVPDRVRAVSGTRDLVQSWWPDDAPVPAGHAV